MGVLGIFVKRVQVICKVAQVSQSGDIFVLTY
jgi:hypothetical protein